MRQLLVFVGAFAQVGLLVFQSLNVNQYRYLAAFLTSVAIGTVQVFVIFSVVSDPKLYAFPFITGGALGSVFAMKFHNRFFRR